MKIGCKLGKLIRLCGAAALLCGSAMASAQYPDKPIKFIVPYPPGGVGDTISREIGNHLSTRLKQAVIVENRPGGSQIIGAQAAAKSEADGYTLFLGSLSSLVLNVGTHKQLPYSPLKDFAPVSLAFETPLYLVVNKDLPVNDVRQLVAYAKSNPGKLSFGSIGSGSSVHLIGEMFKAAAKIDIVHVPYKGSMPALTDLAGGHIQMLFDAGTSALPLVSGGKLKALAVATPARIPGTPNIPTFAEADLPEVAMSAWFGVVVPAGTPKPVVDRLSSEVRAILALPALRERFRSQGVELTGSTPEAMGKQMRDDMKKWQEFMLKTGINPD
jgi:tripartite-type tricarboxylate transporter receptor subunit TctC